MPTHDFVDIGDVLNFEYLRGEIITLNESNDTCTVKIGSAVFNAIIFYHCEPDSILRSNGAIQDGADSLNRRSEAVQEWDETLCDWSQ